MVPHLTRFEPLKIPKVPVIFGATSGGPNRKLMMTLKKACPPPLKLMPTVPDSSDDELVTDSDVSGETLIDEEETRGRNI